VRNISQDSYRTVDKEDGSRLVIERSEFIAKVKRVEREDEAKDWIKAMKAEHRDASHNCSAYVIGVDREHQFYDDNGEPHGTAGRPILGAIDSLELTNVAVVVTRYFGGKKLGVRGLIDAYGQVARDALVASNPVTVYITKEVHIKADYKHVDRIHYLIRENDAQILGETFFADVEIKVDIARNQAENFAGCIKAFAKEVTII
jgi:uncharacterized YigZ family protein